MLPINPHPPLVMFAPTLGALCLFFELVAHFYPLFISKQVRFLVLTLFLIACIASYYSGFYGADFATKLEPQLLKTHQGYARFGLIVLLGNYFIGSLALVSTYSSRALINAYQLMLLVIVGVIFYTSHLGGELVFEHGGGVRNLGYSGSDQN